MSGMIRRADAARAYVLHSIPYRDTSRIVELFTREHGRVCVFARGARGPKSRLAPLLQPFSPLLVSWRGRGDAAQLSQAEAAIDAQGRRPAGLPATHVMSGFYVNELLLKLTTRDDPHPALFDAYARVLRRLGSEPSVEPALRQFESLLLAEVGYGLDVAVEFATGREVDPHARYVYRVGQGVSLALADAPGSVAGRVLRRLAAGDELEPGDYEDARRVLRAAIDYCLEGRELATRAVARALAGRERSP